MLTKPSRILPQFFARPLSLPLGILTPIVLSGCGAGSYEERMAEARDQRQSSQSQQARFDDRLHGPTVMESTGARIRVPKVFEASYSIDSQHPGDGGRVDPGRVKPPFLQDFPGFFICYEAFGPADGTNLAYYCYLGSMPAGDDVEGKILAQLQAAFPSARPSFSEIEVQSPQNNAVSWQHVNVTANQPFAEQGSSQSFARTVEGTFDLYIHEADGIVVIVAWRAPREVAEQISLDELMQLTAGTVSVGG